MPSLPTCSSRRKSARLSKVCVGSLAASLQQTHLLMLCVVIFSQHAASMPAESLLLTISLSNFNICRAYRASCSSSEETCQVRNSRQLAQQRRSLAWIWALCRRSWQSCGRRPPMRTRRPFWCSHHTSHDLDTSKASLVLGPGQTVGLGSEPPCQPRLSLTLSG